MKAAVEKGYAAEPLNEGPARAEIQVCRETGDLATGGCQQAGLAMAESVPDDLVDGRVLCPEHSHDDGRRDLQRPPAYSGPSSQPQRQPPRGGVIDRIFGWLR